MLVHLLKTFRESESEAGARHKNQQPTRNVKWSSSRFPIVCRMILRLPPNRNFKVCRKIALHCQCLLHCFFDYGTAVNIVNQQKKNAEFSNPVCCHPWMRFEDPISHNNPKLIISQACGGKLNGLGTESNLRKVYHSEVHAEGCVSICRLKPR